MVDAKTLSYINLYAILGSIPMLCKYDERAKSLADVKKISIGFSVKNGPAGTLTFDGGECTFVRGCERCDIKIPFSSPEKFNAMIDGTSTPIPVKGFSRLGFLLKNFTSITDILTEYLRASEDALEDEHFFEISTRLMFSVIVGAVAAIGNNDKVGRASASYISDGTIMLAIGDEQYAGIDVSNHILIAKTEKPKSYTSYMIFEDMKLARALFDGKVNAVSCVGMGRIRIGGMISQVDNVNRILDRVALYLA
jgi:hypothetical protein